MSFSTLMFSLPLIDNIYLVSFAIITVYLQNGVCFKGLGVEFGLFQPLVMYI